MSNLLYDALMLGRNKKVELEEYHVASGRKQATDFRVSEDHIDVSNVISDGEFSVRLFQDSPGYLEIEVFCSEHFLIFDKKVITSDDFHNGVYEFKFMVISDRLHNGRNFASLIFRTSRQNLEIPVNVDNRIRVHISDVNPRERLIRLEQLLLSWQMGKMEQWQWRQESLDLLNEIPGGDEISLYLMLYKAQLYITGGDDIRAKNNIEHVGTQIPKLEEKNYDLYCYFVYLASLYEEVEGVVNSLNPDALQPDDLQAAGPDPRVMVKSLNRNMMDLSALEKVRWVYTHFPSWGILWMLFYMDPFFRFNSKGRLDEMQNLFYKYGCISPVMYLEALRIYQADPSSLTRMGQFDLHVLNFAVKHSFLTPEVAEQVSKLLVEQEDVFYSPSEKNLWIKILTYIYDKYPGDTALSALCRMLMSADKRQVSYHHYFDRAIGRTVYNEEILNYYIYTLDQENLEQLPDLVIRHFLDHQEELKDYKHYMYANIITNKFASPQDYKECQDEIVKFAENQIILGKAGTCLAVIYKEVLEKNLLTRNMKNNLFDVICTKEILTDNSRMHSVLVFHKELQVYQESTLINGSAYIRTYSTDALILFKDTAGNLYHNIEYQVNPLLPAKEYIDICIKDVPISKYMLIGDTLPILRAYKAPLEILEFFTSHKIDGQFRREYEQELLKNTVAYYTKNSRDEQVYDELLKFRSFDLLPETRGKLIEIMMKRDLADEAFEEIREYGTCQLSNQSLAELAHAYIGLHGTVEDDLLTAICEAGYGENGFDEYIFNYMYLFYNGRMDLLIELFRACNAYKKPANIIEERILKKAVRTGEHPAAVSYVFSKYYEDGNDRELLHQYMEFRARTYLYEIMDEVEPEGTADLTFFDRMEDEMIQGQVFDDDSMISYLLHRTNLESPSDRQIRNLEHCLKDLVRRGKMLEEFKYFRKYFELPSTLENNIIISAFSENPEDKPFIAYEITGPAGKRSGVEEMEEIFRHAYVKYFTLFYGETVHFTMDGETSAMVKYEDMDIQHDGSRYAILDDMIRYKAQKDKTRYLQTVRDFYVQDKLVDILF